MLYIKISNHKYPIDKFEVFTTQLGRKGVRIIGDTPLANGFEIYEDDVLIGDMSEYTFLYREDDTCKEYTKVEEEIIPVECFASGDVPVNPIQSQINALNRRVSELTPYEMSKQAYIGDTACEFETDMTGDITAYVMDADGNYIQCTITRETGKITVLFDALEQIATVNVSIK